MNTRIFSAACCATTVTAGLLMLMTALIASANPAMTERMILLPRLMSAAPPPPPPPKSNDLPEPIDRPMATPTRMPVGPTISFEHPTLVVSGPTLGLTLGQGGGGEHGRPIPINGGDSVAIEIMPVKPTYPRRMLTRGVEGSAIVAYDISETGRAVNARIISSTHAGFENAALNAIGRFRFKPRVQDGKPLVTRGLQKQFSFTIDK